jgi:hypothetical protein
MKGKLCIALATVNTVIFFLVLGLNSALVWYPGMRLAAWGATLILIVGFLAVLGFALTGRCAGIIIDNRAKVSLSKFQMTLWSVVVISSLITIVALNLHYYSVGLNGEQAATLHLRSPEDYDPVDIKIPAELLVALGISGFSLVATPLILSTKSETPPTQADLDRTLRRLGLSETDVSNAGKVFGRTKPDLALWADMFRGDELGNAATVDLSKVQQFLITLLLVGTYCGFLLVALRKEGPIGTLPPLSEGFVWLMSISHASYLAFKAAPHTRTGDGDDGSAVPTDPRVRPVG